MSFFLRRYKQILRFFPLLFYLQFPWGKRWSFDGWNFKNFRTKARWGTATWSTSWDVVASWSLATMRSCFLDFAANDGFGENSQAVKMKNLCWMWTRGFPFFVKFEEANLFPGDVVTSAISLDVQVPILILGERLWKYSGCIPTPKRLHDAQNELRTCLKNKKHWTVLQYHIQLVYIMIMILQGSTLGRFAKYDEILK